MYNFKSGALKLCVAGPQVALFLVDNVFAEFVVRKFVLYVLERRYSICDGRFCIWLAGKIAGPAVSQCVWATEKFSNF